MSLSTRGILPTPEIWGGVECTYNRVGDEFVDQCVRSGHANRIEDLALFAELGVNRLRYPFLWEKAAPNSIHEIDWTWSDERVRELQRLGLTPIAGLVHHGSGPRYTNLIDPNFPELLAQYAKAFAERYPWITDYTPINEPLTTARFSGLYGVWFPHGRDDKTFLKALFFQIKATVLAMRAIRSVNPLARLIQTEDLGRATGTKQLAYQIEFENHRRWLSFDLLCGRVNESHALYGYLRRSGISREEIAWFEENPCPPDILGLNHYLLSNRFLDHRLELYPPLLHGGNGLDRYADVGAVDTGEADSPSPESIFREARERYSLPLAITEVHVRGSRESQLRWFQEIWSAACRLKDSGANFVAVTAWSLLGAYDWNSLCTRSDSFYESGVFDLRAPRPRPTALAQMIRSYSKGLPFHHPLLDQPGWWKQKESCLFAPRRGSQIQKKLSSPILNSRPILITRDRGLLGAGFSRICEARNIPYRLLSPGEIDFTDRESMRDLLDAVKPWAVINTAGYRKVDEAEQNQEEFFLENVIAPEILAENCARLGIPLLCFSTDLVFNGESNSPYLESHPVAPINVYGNCKAQCERRVLSIHPHTLIVRTSSFFSPWDDQNFLTYSLKSLAAGGQIQAIHDLTLSPTYLPDLVHAALDLLIDGETGIVHLTNQGKMTWAELAFRGIDFAEKHPRKNILSKNVLDRSRIQIISSAELSRPARRPAYSALSTERANILPTFDDALDRYFHELEVSFLHQNQIIEGARV